MQTAQDLLLRRTGFHKCRFPYYGVDLKIHRMDYPFLIRNAFFKTALKREREDLEKILKTFVKSFLAEFFSSAIKAGEKLDMGKCIDSLFGFHLDSEKIFKEISRGEDKPATIFIPYCNANLEIKRFGNCLGVRIKSGNQRAEEHCVGTRVLEEMCLEEDLAVTEFCHSVECIIPLPKKSGGNNSINIDFFQVHRLLDKYCPDIRWHNKDKFSSSIITSYTRHSEYASEWIYAGNFCSDMEVSVKLIHHKASSEKNAMQWRKGNLTESGDGKYLFADGGDVYLSILFSDRFPMSTFLKSIDPETDVIESQDNLLKTSVAAYHQLCAMETQVMLRGLPNRASM